MIFKKGDSTKWENYRPISLLNSLYKILAAILKVRIADVIDPFLQKTQFGFRKNRSTSQALQFVRRIAEMGESLHEGINQSIIMILLDWEKAFDKIKQDKLLESLERMSLPNKIIASVRNLYSNPKFAVNMGGSQSSWKKQRRGIRQGCPLSPYLFLIIMTEMFHDIHKDEKLEKKTLTNTTSSEHSTTTFSTQTIP